MIIAHWLHFLKYNYLQTGPQIGSPENGFGNKIQLGAATKNCS
jgi:hypothetical protein